MRRKEKKSGIKTSMHHLAQRGRLEWFGNHEIRAAIPRQFQRIIVMQPRAAGHRNNFQLRARFAQLQYGFNPFFVGHDNIHQDQIISRRMIGNILQSLMAIGRLINLMTQPAQDMRQRKAQLRVIIHDQNISGNIFHSFILRRKPYALVKIQGG